MSAKREVITLQVGQCGVNIGSKFWESILNEHGVNEEGIYTGHNTLQIENIGTFFTESHTGKFVPRSVFVDLEPGTVDMVHNGKMGKLFSLDKSICGTGGGSNNFAKGYYTDGAELLPMTMELVRKDAEDCDCMQGFQVMHALGGGCGSGFASLLMMKLLEEYTDRITAAYSVFPSSKVSDIVVEPYNAVLAIHQLVEYSAFSTILDNQALINICHKKFKIPQPTYADMNHLISFALSGTTTCLRFPGQLNSDLRKIATNMIPFPRLHFFMTGYAPMCDPRSMQFRSLSITELMLEMFQPKTLMADCNPLAGLYLTAATIFRGHVSTKEVECEILKTQNRNSNNFVSWIPQNVKAAICDVAAPGAKVSSTFLSNNTAMSSIMKRLAEEFSAMIRKKAFLHWYVGEGMEETEFSEAESDLIDLIGEYQQYEGTETLGQPDLTKES